MRHGPAPKRDGETLDELIADRDRLQRILATLANAVFVVDADGVIVYANPSAARLSGFETFEEMQRVPLEQLLSRYVMLDADGRLLRDGDMPSQQIVSGESSRAEVLLRVVDRVSGEEFWRMLRSTPLDGDDGRPLAVTVIEDVTDAKKAERRQAFLARAGELLASSLDYGETLRSVARLAVPTLADWCGVDVLDERGLRQQLAVFHLDPEKIQLARELNERFPPDPASPAGVHGVIASGEPSVYNDITDQLINARAQNPEHAELIRSLGMRALMVVPMKLRDRTIGAITFVSSETRRSFGDQDLAFAMELARRAALAVENARLYTSRTEVARTLQQSLLPERLEPPPGWLAASSFRPGDDINEVGGDFFDLVALPDDELLVFVGDVTGKGVQAAALTSLARHTLAVGARFDPRPAGLMRLLENVLNERDEPSPVTVACVRLTRTPGGAVARITCAGHPPPLLLRPGAPAEDVGVFDVLLGAGVGTRWRETEVALAPGDTLLLYTDGVIDTPGVDARFGEDRLGQVAAAGPLDPAAVLERVGAATSAWQAARSVDDRAMLALQLTEAPGG